MLDPKSFCPIDEFKRLMDGLVAYIKSSPPAAGFDEVLVPGEPEFRTLRRRSIEGIPIDPVTLSAIRDHASDDPIHGIRRVGDADEASG
ncbi:MAG: Ldh family oxidoreductase [Pirellulales bacterium]